MAQLGLVDQQEGLFSIERAALFIYSVFCALEKTVFCSTLRDDLTGNKFKDCRSDAEYITLLCFRMRT